MSSNPSLNRKSSAPQRVVSEWEKNSREFVRVGLGDFKGHSVIDIRVWYRDAENKLRPSPKGITLDLRHLSRLRKALRAAAKAGR